MGGQIQHMLKGNVELNEGNTSLLKEADRLLDESKEARKRARVLKEEKQTFMAKLHSLKACYDLPREGGATQSLQRMGFKAHVGVERRPPQT